jgi:hypothetical protein
MKTLDIEAWNLKSLIICIQSDTNLIYQTLTRVSKIINSNLLKYLASNLCDKHHIVASKRTE